MDVLTAKASWNSKTSMSFKDSPALSKTFGVLYVGLERRENKSHNKTTFLSIPSSNLSQASGTGNQLTPALTPEAADLWGPETRKQNLWNEKEQVRTSTQARAPPASHSTRQYLR